MTAHLPTDLQKGGRALERIFRRESTAVNKFLLCASVTLAALCLGAAFWERLHDGYANVDDYLYSGQITTIYTGLQHGPLGLARAWMQYGSNSPLYPTLAVPISPVAEGPGAFLALQIPVWIALITVGYKLTREFTGSHRSGCLTIFLLGSLPAVTGYAVMLNFALISSAMLLWSFYAYVRSRLFQDARWSAALGFVVGLLLLSRVVAIVYVAALTAVIALDSRKDLLRNSLARRNALIACAVIAFVAGPWWVLCGRSALSYLMNAGYSSNSGFSDSRSPAELVLSRASSLFDLVGIVVCVVLLATSISAAWRVPSKNVRGAAGVAGLILLGLATSSNRGTGFELPAVCILVPVAVAGISGWLSPTIGLSCTIGVAALMQFAGGPIVNHVYRQTWVRGYPGRIQLSDALGALRSVDAPFINRQLATELNGRHVTVLRDDAVVNIPAINWFNSNSNRSTLSTIPYGAVCPTRADLAASDRVIWGSSRRLYHSRLDRKCTEEALQSNGFSLLEKRSLAAANTVEIWGRTTYVSS